MDKNKLCPGCMNEMTGDRICSICGYDSVSKNDVDCLSTRFLLCERYIIGKVIERTSESVLYLAWDNNKSMVVDVKEYFPLNISKRNADKTVSVIGDENLSFNEGLLEFLELNRKIKKLDISAVFEIYDVFEGNGTAYTVTAHNAGITLSDFLERNGGVLKWEQARPLFLPLIDTVITLNENKIFHGAVSPESISVGRDGKLRLTNISIIETRFVSQRFATGIYPGCAAPEQYLKERVNIGSFTDVYGLSATLFRVLIGTLPPPANERMGNDSLSIPSHFADELPRQVLVSIADGLQVKIANRTQSVEKFRDELVYGETPENIKKAQIKAQKAEKEKSDRISEKIDKNGNLKGSSKPDKKQSSAKYAVISALLTALIFVVVAGVLSFTVLKDYFFPQKEIQSSSEIDSMPSVDSIGDVEPGADNVKVKLYPVPDLRGKYYSQIFEDEALDELEVIITEKKFSDSMPRGTIISQSVDAGKEVQKDTVINVVISLGPKSIKIADVLGLEPDAAKLELLKQGFLYENIEVVEKYDSDKEPNTVIDQSPEYGKSVSTDIAVKIYVNTYEEETEDTEESFF